MSISLLIAFLTLSFLLSYWGCGRMIRILSTNNIIDTPNHRSNHKTPTPTGGGIAILSALLFGSIPVMVWGNYPASIMMMMCLTVFLVSFISFLDDIKDLHFGLRLVVHILASCFSSFIALKNGSLFGGMIPYNIEFILLVISIAGFMNLFNFMDGIDGMTGMQSIYLCIGFCICFYHIYGSWEILYFLAVIIVCISGFLIYNWHPAKLFMGDAGSISLGFIFGTMFAFLATSGYITQAVILPMYYLSDAGVVVLIRILMMEKFWLPHSKFFFQRAVRNGNTHSRVVLHVLITNLILLSLMLLSMYVNMISLHSYWYVFVTLSICICYISIKKMLTVKSLIK